MSIHAAEANLLDPPAAAPAPPIPDAVRPPQPGEPERPLGPARGVLHAMLIAVPFWVLLGFTLFLLI